MQTWPRWWVSTRLRERGCLGGRAWVIDDHVQIVCQEIGTLEAVTKRKIPLEPVGGPIGLARGSGDFRFAGPVEIGLNIMEGTDFDVGSRDHGLAPVEPQLFIEQCRHGA